MESILLASKSPRRRELLEAAGIPFDLFDPDIDESMHDGLPPSDRVVALASEKVKAAVRYTSSTARLVLGADTMVCMPQAEARYREVGLGKPDDAEDAGRMLRMLAGSSHFVRTGLALLDRVSGRMRTSRSDSSIHFAAMSDAEIEAYIASGEWSGAAGGYRIQGLATFFIDRIEGSWTGVVGLPMRELYAILSNAGYRIPTMEKANHS